MTLITLQVGERRYFSAKQTLIQGSTYFKARLTGTLLDDKEADGSYFVDRDGHLFEHILSFLRSGICPLFHDKINGFDHHKYIRLCAEAEYFGVEKLREWISAKRYERAIRFDRFAYLREDLKELDASVTDDDKAQYIPMWRTRKVYLCPRGIPPHRGKPDSCGQACRNASHDYGIEYDDEQELVVVVIRLKKMFHSSVLKP